METKPIPAGWVQIDPSVLDGSVGDLALVNAQYGICLLYTSASTALIALRTSPPQEVAMWR